MTDNQELTSKELNKLLRDMRCDVIWTNEATMPIPLYERMKEAIKQLIKTKEALDIAMEALESIVGSDGELGCLKNHSTMGDVLLFRGCRLDVRMALPEHQQTIVDAIDVLIKAKAALNTLKEKWL